MWIKIKGFIYSTIRKVPIDANSDLETDKGWIVAISVDEEEFEIVDGNLDEILTSN